MGLVDPAPPVLLGDAALVFVVEGEAEGIAKGGERPLGGIRLGGLKRHVVRGLGGVDRPAPVPIPSRTIDTSPARTVIRTFVE